MRLSLGGGFLLPLAIIAGGIAMAVARDEPLWLMYCSLLAIAAGMLARRTTGS